MDNPIDNIVDLGLVNYVKHPSDPNYIIYRFADIGRAESFEMGLVELKIWYEKSSQKGRIKTFYLFGVHKSDYESTQKLNYEVEAKHKKFLIPHSGLRYLLIGFSAIIVTLSIMGYCQQQKKLRSFDHTDTSVSALPSENKNP